MSREVLEHVYFKNGWHHQRRKAILNFKRQNIYELDAYLRELGLRSRKSKDFFVNFVTPVEGGTFVRLWK